MDSLKIAVIVEKTATGYSAYSEAYGAYTTGGTLDELRANVATVLRMALPEADRGAEMAVSYVYDVPAFFDAYKVLNASALAKRMGMTQSLLSQYISGTKKAGPIMRARLMDGVHELSKELAGIKLVKS